MFDFAIILVIIKTTELATPLVSMRNPAGLSYLGVKIKGLMMKDKLTVEQQIQHMRAKGIQFNIVSEEEAMGYLAKNTYYFKIKAYAKNYDKYRTTEKVGQYVNLEFAYLKDLAIIDMLLRHFILVTSVDLEHINDS